MVSWPNEDLATFDVQTKPKTEEIMRTNKLMLIATMALGVLLACGTAVMAQDNKEAKGQSRPGGHTNKDAGSPQCSARRTAGQDADDHGRSGQENERNPDA